MIKKLLYNAMPIVGVDRNHLLVLKHGSVFNYCLENGKLEHIYKFPESFQRVALSYSRLATRRFGLNEIQGALCGDEGIFINYHRHYYYITNLGTTNTVTQIHNNGGANGRSLYLSSCSKGVLFGDYGYNPKKKEMSIYCFSKESKQIEKVYTFSEGMINHIHNLIEDITTGRIWIFTGDFNESAAIYYTDDFFKNVNLYASGDQNYRGCCGISIDNRLLFATDTPTKVNHLVLTQDGRFDLLEELNGSCIYGYIKGNHFIVSTTVENQTDELYNKRNAYRYNLGEGIKDWFVEILDIALLPEITINKVLRIKKDILPMMPFKYGCFRFPSKLFSNGIICMGQAVKHYDQWLIMIES